MMRVAINGFGRIGRLVLRALHEVKAWPSLDIVAINDTGPLEKMHHLLKWDSVHGPFPYEVLQDKKIHTSYERDPSKLDWGKLDIDLVLECTGSFSSRARSSVHLEKGAKRVLIASPAEGVDLTLVYGVNHTDFKPEHTIISNASCTTNCLAPVIKVLQESLTLERGYMTTVHAMTGDQNIIDASHRDFRRARTADLSMIPTSTGATKAIELIFPQLKGKLLGSAIRVPTNNVSLIDFVFNTAEKVRAEDINMLFTQAATGELRGILDVTREPLVSIDFNHTRPSSIVDLLETQVINDHMSRILAWYDNEWAFANRMLDVASHIERSTSQ